jgi:hypothetical protein
VTDGQRFPLLFGGFVILVAVVLVGSRKAGEPPAQSDRPAPHALTITYRSELGGAFVVESEERSDWHGCGFALDGERQYGYDGGTVAVSDQSVGGRGPGGAVLLDLKGFTTKDREHLEPVADLASLGVHRLWAFCGGVSYAGSWE